MGAETTTTTMARRSREWLLPTRGPGPGSSRFPQAGLPQELLSWKSHGLILTGNGGLLSILSSPL